MPRSISKKGKGSREVCSWFIVAKKPNSYIINKWLVAFADKFINEKEWKYFMLHDTLCDLYDSDGIIKEKNR